MIVKKRELPAELVFLRFLKARIDLAEKDANRLVNLEKGYKGELAFDQFLEQLTEPFLVLNDLKFESNNEFFQIDSLVISSSCQYLFEIKNFEGDYVYDAEKLCTLQGTEIKNPIYQLKRSEILLKKIFHQVGFQPNLQVFVVFIHPEFFLYQTPVDLPIIFRSQLNRFFEKIQRNSSKVLKKHMNLANQLIALDVPEYPYKRLPPYSFDQLKKGICCSRCASLETYYKDRMIYCRECGIAESCNIAISRTIKEFQLLFPDKKITTNNLFNWCNNSVQKKTLQRLISKEFTLVEQGKASYYVR